MLSNDLPSLILFYLHLRPLFIHRKKMTKININIQRQLQLIATYIIIVILEIRGSITIFTLHIFVNIFFLSFNWFLDFSTLVSSPIYVTIHKRYGKHSANKKLRQYKNCYSQYYNLNFVILKLYMFSIYYYVIIRSYCI